MLFKQLSRGKMRPLLSYPFFRKQRTKSEREREAILGPCRKRKETLQRGSDLEGREEKKRKEDERWNEAVCWSGSTTQTAKPSR